jgi:rhodanese-related sulfurtransferase
MISHIQSEDLKKKIDSHEVVVVEALPHDAYERCHLPGAKNLPADEVRTQASEVLPDKNAEIVVYCTSAT